MSGGEMNDMTANDLQAEIAARVQASGTSFYSAMRLLPPNRRNAMFAIYAFCREVDDIADEDRELETKKRQLAEWRAEIDRLYAGNPLKPIGRALSGPVAEFHLRRQDFLDVIDGMEMDAIADIQAPSLATLDQYCARVASAVGHLSVRAFGAGEPAADEVAHHLGRALQLTNILRDLAEDADRNRLYLPRELLQRHGIEATDPETVLDSPNLPAVCRDLAAIARGHFESAQAAMKKCAKGPMRPAAIMGSIYRALLDRLTADGWKDIYEPVAVPKWRKMWLAFRHGFL